MKKPYIVQDKYFLQAKRDGYRARSAYKIKDIQNKFKLIKKGDAVVDLGAFPGSFMQAIFELVGEQGSVFGVDLCPIDSFDRPNMHTFQGDVFEKDGVLTAIRSKGFEQVDVVTSDLAPKTTGIKDVDQWASCELTDQAMFLSTQLLKPGGHFIGKVFEGEDLHWLIRRVKKKFKKVKMFKPPSCRERSFETYIVAMDFKGL